MSLEDRLDDQAYVRDPTLFWLWPKRWAVPQVKASQRHAPFWMFIPRTPDRIVIEAEPSQIQNWLAFGPDSQSPFYLRDRVRADTREDALAKLVKIGGRVFARGLPPESIARSRSAKINRSMAHWTAEELRYFLDGGTCP